MAQLLRFSALAAFTSAVTGYAIIGEMPTQTVGYGLPFMSEPTEAPSMELVKKNLEKRALINTCTEWTIPGGFGQPLCSNSETCLFTSDDFGNLWEGCGQTSISYNWITECWDYPQIGTPPVSQIYCDEAAPSCGFLAFQFDNGNTYYNFGCSTVSYSLYVDLISTTEAGASQTVVLAGGGTSSVTEEAPVTETVTATPTSVPAVIQTAFGQGTATTNPTQTQAGSSSSSTNVPVIGSHGTKSKTPIGAIVGGVVGGIALIAFLAFLVWFILRKRRQDAAATQAHGAPVQQHQADAATAAIHHNPNRISEIGGMMKPAQPEHAGAFAPQQQAYANGNEKLMGQQVNEYPSPTPQSPPPVYAQPNIQAQQQPIPQAQQQPIPPVQQLQAPTSPYPPSNYTELDNQNLQPGNARTSVPPVSPVGTYNSNATEMGGINTYQSSPSPPVSQMYQPPPNVQEMGIYQQQPASSPIPQQQLYQPPPNVQEMGTYQQQPASSPTPLQQQQPYQPPNVQEMGTYQQQPASSPIPQHQPYQPPPNVQEMSGNGTFQQQPVTQQQGYQPPPNMQEMSGGAASVRPVQSGGFDMSGAPMSDDFGHHELA